MKNDLIESRLRRDEALSSFLTAETAQYTDIEADVAPLRQQLAAALAQARELAQPVLTADNEGRTTRKKGQRNELTQLLRRLIVGLQAVATSTRDARLLALAGQVSRLPKLGEAAFIDEARRLLSLAPERSAALSKRRFTPEHYREATTLTAELRRSINEGRPADGEGRSRDGLERLVKQNTRTIAQLRTYFRPYQLDEPDFWARFAAAARVERRGGSPDGANATG